MTVRAPILLLPLLLGACAPETSESEPTVQAAEPSWWVLAEEDQQGADTGLEGQELARIWGALELQPKGYAGAAGVEVWEQGELSCEVSFFLTEIGPTQDCASCEQQFEVIASQVVAGASQGCGLVGIDPERLEGQVVALGRVGGVLWMVTEDGWEPVGVAEEQGGRFDFEVRFLEE